MGIEDITLTLFLHQVSEGDKFRIWMGYKFPYGAGGAFNLGLNKGAKETAGLIKEKLENMHFSFPIREVHLHNRGDYKNGEKDKLPEQLYHDIHSFLRDKPPKVYFEPEVLMHPSG